jgi:hypothetical protein
VRPEAVVTHCDRVYDLLSDGKPHTHHEGYALGVILHSRISDLRRRGIEIRHWRENGTSYYQIGSELTERDGHARHAGDESRLTVRSVSSSDKLAGTGSGYDHGDNGETQRSCDTAAPLSDGVPVPAEIVGQLSLEAA